jgi:predicted aminopeptidase
MAPSSAVRSRPLQALLVLALTGCVETRYVLQAGLGQLDLVKRARPVDEVLADPETDDRLRLALLEAARATDYAQARGLETHGNYRKYVELDRDSVVWFMSASPPLEIQPKTWNFPIVGSFPYLGWFDYSEALEIRRRLVAEGYDVDLREVHAYSTGGWFHDPIVSTMIPPGEDGLRTLVNTLFHEITHANVLIKDQSTFNESVAVFVGDTMAEEYLADRFGPKSAEVRALHDEIAQDRAIGDRLTRVYRELEALYASSQPDSAKLAKKAALLNRVRSELDLPFPLNNAVMVGFKTYNSGLPEFGELYATCGKSWPRFLAAVRRVDGSWFPSEQAEEIADVVRRAVRRGCPAASLKVAAQERQAHFDPGFARHAARHHVDRR